MDDNTRYEFETKLDMVRDEVDMLETELHEAVKVAFNWGATDWVKLNYFGFYNELTKEKTNE